MCRAVKFHFDEREWESRFGHSHAKLPVLDREQQILLRPWGRRPTERGKLPLGGIARLAHIHGNRWDKFFPKPVRVIVKSFCAVDVAGNEHWHVMTKGQFLQGLYARTEKEARFYLVVQDSPPEEAEYEVWPRILAAP